ncbi:hypothetical protein MRX96_041106 [Rhipicephalus microplus]
MGFDRIQARLLACLFVAIARSETEFPGPSSIVFPEVYEQRTDASEKVLVVGDGYSLNLVKASVLSDYVLLRVHSGSRVIDRHVDGHFYERHLYQDTRKEASLIVKPRSDGHYHVTGLLNYTHRIEPLTSQERSSSDRAAHKISKIIFKDGTPDADSFLVDGYEDTATPAITPQERALTSFTIELYAISDLQHTMHFGDDRGANMDYFLAFWHSETDEEYLDARPDNKLVSNETLIKLREYTWLSRDARKADVVFLVTGRDLVDITSAGIRNNTAGVAYLGQACRVHKVGIGEDDAGLFSGVHSVAHELGHLLSSHHDGEGSSSGCPAKDGYLMNPYTSGRNRFHFSNCSKRAIAAFLKSGYSYCLKDHHKQRHRAFLPNDTLPLPGQVMSGEEYCEKHFSYTYPNVTYTKWDSDLLKCKLRCCLYLKEDGKPEYAIRTAFDGTPCNRFRPEMDQNKRRHVAFLPNDTVKLPGEVMSGDKYCKLYFPRPNVSYVKWDSDLRQCKFRCKLSVKANGDPEYAIRFAFDGTPCNRSQPNMKCKNTKCV